MRNILSFLIALAAIFCSPAFIFAGDVALPVPSTPQQMEVSTASAPMDVRAEDAAALIEQMKASSGMLGSSVSNVQAGQAASSSSGSSYTIMLKPPEVVNASPLFQFRDVTNRSLSGKPVLPMSERSSAVESYRQSIIKERK